MNTSKDTPRKRSTRIAKGISKGGSAKRAPRKSSTTIAEPMLDAKTQRKVEAMLKCCMIEAKRGARDNNRHISPGAQAWLLSGFTRTFTKAFEADPREFERRRNFLLTWSYKLGAHAADLAFKRTRPMADESDAAAAVQHVRDAAPCPAEKKVTKGGRVRIIGRYCDLS